MECLAEKNRGYLPRWQKANPDRCRALAKAFRERNPGYSVENRRKNWTAQYARLKSDPNRRLAHDLRAAICGQLRRGDTKKATATTVLIGRSFAQFRSHIERQWLRGMSWNNWGRGPACWHLDHIRPIASFDLTDPDQQRACFHFTNYQPLWSEDNLRKGATWDGEA